MEDTLTWVWDPVLRRYGTLDDLLTWALEHSELKTLQHGLSEAGFRGRAALQRLCSVLESPDAVPTAGLSAESRLAFVYRGQLVLGHPDEAGTAPLALPGPHWALSLLLRLCSCIVVYRFSAPSLLHEVLLLSYL